MEALLARRAALAQKKADLERRVRELGSLPADAFERYRGQALPALHALLAKAQAQLKKFQCGPHLGELGCDSGLGLGDSVQTAPHGARALWLPTLLALHELQEGPMRPEPTV